MVCVVPSRLKAACAVLLRGGAYLIPNGEAREKCSKSKGRRLKRRAEWGKCSHSMSNRRSRTRNWWPCLTGP
jgi:hypothetical protein